MAEKSLNDIGKVLNDVASELGSVEGIAENKGAVIKFLRNFGEVKDLLDKFSKDTLKKLLSDLPKSNKKIGEYITKLAEEEKITQKIIDQKKQFIDFRAKEIESIKKEFVEKKKGLTETISLAQIQKNILQSNFQLQKQNIEQLERGFFKPIKDLLKSSNVIAFSTQLASSGVKASGEIAKAFIGDMKAANRVVMSQLYGQVQTTMVNAAQEFAEEVFNEIIHLPKELFKSFSEGREKYFEKKREQVINKEEHATEHLNETIQKYSEILDRTENKWNLMTKHGFNVFTKFDNAINGNKSHVTDSMVGLAGASKEKIAEVKNGDSTSKFLRFANKSGAFMSGLGGATSFIIDVVGKLTAGIFDKIKEVIAVGMEILIERAKEQEKLKIELLNEFGTTNRTVEVLLKKRDELFLTKGLPLNYEDIKEAYSGTIQVYGLMNAVTEKQIEYATMFNKVYKVSAEESAEYFKMLSISGFKSTKYIEKFNMDVELFAKKYGVSGREVMRDIVKSTQWIALVGNKKMVEGFAKSASELRRMGLHIESMVKMMDSFESFDSTIENIFQLNAALGTTIDPMKMHVMSMMGDVSGIQKEIFNNLDLSQQLNTIQVKAISKTLGLTYEEVRAMEKGLHIRKEWNSLNDVTKSQMRDIFKGTDAMTRIENMGFKNKEEQMEFLDNKIQETYQKYKYEFKNFEEFISAMGNPKSKLGSEMRKEVQIAVMDVDKQESMESILKKMLSVDEEKKRVDEKWANENKKSLVELNSAMQELNKMFIQLLGWAIGVATPMLSGLVRFFGLYYVGDVVDDIGSQLEMAVRSSASRIKVPEETLGLGGINLFKEALEKDLSGGYNILSALNPLDETKEKKHIDYLESKGLSRNSFEMMQETEKPGLIASILNTSTNKFMTAGNIAEQIMKNKGILHIWDKNNELRKAYLFLKEQNEKSDWTDAIAHPRLSSTLSNAVAYIEKYWKAQENKQISEFSTGGYVSGKGNDRDDLIPAMLSNGEYVINAKSVRMLGKDFLDAINNSSIKGFKNGGLLLNKIDESRFANISPLTLKKQETMASLLAKKDAEIRERESKMPVKSFKTEFQLKQQAYDEVMQDFYRKQSEIRKNHPINKAINNLKGLVGMVGQYLYGKLAGVAGLLGIDVSELDPYNLLDVDTDLLDKDIKGVGSVISYAGMIKGGQKGIQSSEKIFSKLTGKLGKSAIKYAEKIPGVSEKLAHAGIVGGGAYLGRSLSSGHSPELGHAFQSIVAARFGAKGALTESILNIANKDNHKKVANKDNHKKVANKDNHKKDGGLVGSFASGTYKNSLPGFINTNDFNTIQAHPNESVSIMNQQQKIQRDELLEKLIAMLKQGFIVNTDLKINERSFGELITKLVWMEANTV